MKKRRLMLCGLVSIIMAFVMAVPMVASATETTVTEGTLQDAINKAESGDVIKLGQSFNESITIPAGKNITLDLNGQTLTGGANDAIYVSLGATLTINDSVGNGSVKAATGGKAAVFNNGTTTIKNGYYTRSAGQWYTIVNHGTMTIENAKADASIDGTSSLIENGYSNYAKKDERAGYVAGTNAKNPELTIKDGTFVSSGYNAVKNDDGGILNINGGSFSAVRENGAVIQNWHRATITAGKFTAKGESGTISIGAYNTGVNDGVTTISGGTFSAEKNAVFAAGVGGNAKGKLTVENGIFSGKMSSELMNSAYDTTFSGGEFTDDPAQYVADGKVAIKFARANKDGNYYVGTQEEIQEIANTAKDGDTIDVIKGSITLNMTTPGVNVNNDRSNEKGEVIVNGTPLNPGYGMEIQKPATDPTKPSQDQTQKPSDTAKADKSAKTGDDFNMIAAGAAALAAIIVMAAVAVTGRRHRQR